MEREMNRRRVLKMISGFLGSFPFISWGVDIARPGKDVTGLTIYDNQGNITDIIIFDEPLSDYDVKTSLELHEYDFEYLYEKGRLS
jgi:hypothetical protein